MSAAAYRQLADELVRRILAGQYATGSLPSSGELATEFCVGVQTVRRALIELDAEGLTAGRQGRTRRVVGPQVGVTTYELIAATVREEIEAGLSQPGERMAGEFELARRFAVSRASVRAALALLETSGHVVRRAGRRYVTGESADSDLAYERTATALRSRMWEGRYRPEQRLPGEHSLAGEFGVSRPTVRAALARLQDQGYLRSEPRRGWFVVRTIRKDAAP